MGITLKRFQEKCVDYLYNRTVNEQPDAQKIIVQSPTGSGKTIILLSYIEKYLETVSDTIFVWLTPGKGELEEQSRDKMLRYYPNARTGDLNDILSSGFDTKTTYFINWEVVNNKKNVALKDGERKNLFERIADAHRNKLNFIVIIDEEHLNNTKKSDDILNALAPKYEIRVSATPLMRTKDGFYKINEVDVINEELITKALYVNNGLSDTYSTDVADEATLLIKKANSVRQSMVKAYAEEGENVNPLVLIQFPNMSRPLIEHVEKVLTDMGYTYDNGLLAAWFSAETAADKKSQIKDLLKKRNLEDEGTGKSITDHDAKPAFLLFKQALATGWDCPRAKILVKLREGMNETFETQTLGRLRRMPKAHHYGREILDCSFLYTFDEKYKEQALKDGAKEQQKVFLKDEPRKFKLTSETRYLDNIRVDARRIRKLTYEKFVEKYGLTKRLSDNRTILENHGYVFGTVLKREALIGRFITQEEITRSNNKTITVGQEVQPSVHSIDRRKILDSFKNYLGLNYEETAILFRLFFRQSPTKKKNPEQILSLSNAELIAFIINNANLLRDFFKDMSKYVINDSQDLFETDKQVRENEYKLPLEMYYDINSFGVDFKDIIVDSNVYKGYNRGMLTAHSGPEQKFELYCESSENVKFVYKNGDKGQDYLSIVYRINGVGTQMLFYPDYIVVTQDGKFWIIETKGGESHGISQDIDTFSPVKFMALKRFAKAHGYNYGFVRAKDNSLYICTESYSDSIDSAHWKPLEEVLG